MSSFIEMCRAGQAQPADIDDFIDAWHANPGTVPLYTFLGMTRDEYASWIENTTSLPTIISGLTTNPGEAALP